MVRTGWSRQDGATAAEYAIMVSLIALVIFGAVVSLGRTTGEMYDCAASAVGGMPEEPDC